MQGAGLSDWSLLTTYGEISHPVCMLSVPKHDLYNIIFIYDIYYIAILQNLNYCPSEPSLQ